MQPGTTVELAWWGESLTTVFWVKLHPSKRYVEVLTPCDVRNMYAPFPCTQLLKTLGISKIMCLLYAYEMTGGWGLLGSLRMGAGYQGNQPCHYRVINFGPSHPPPDLQQGERGWSLN